jgi:hypothetical protein
MGKREDVGSVILVMTVIFELSRVWVRVYEKRAPADIAEDSESRSRSPAFRVLRRKKTRSAKPHAILQIQALQNDWRSFPAIVIGAQKIE